MEESLKDLSITELRALLRQETRKFLLLLEQEGSIQELEVSRNKLREVGDILKEKELLHMK